MMANQRTGCGPGPATALIWPLTRSNQTKARRIRKKKRHAGTRKTEPHTWPKDESAKRTGPVENARRKQRQHEFRNLPNERFCNHRRSNRRVNVSTTRTGKMRRDFGGTRIGARVLGETRKGLTACRIISDIFSWQFLPAYKARLLFL